MGNNILEKKKQLRAQKTAIRHIPNGPRFTHTNAYFQEYNILKIQPLHGYRLLCTYKSAISMHNGFLLYMFMLQNHTTQYGTRHNSPWCIPKLKPLCHDQSVSIVLTTLLNNLYAENMSLQNLLVKSIMKYFISKY